MHGDECDITHRLENFDALAGVAEAGSDPVVGVEKKNREPGREGEYISKHPSSRRTKRLEPEEYVSYRM